MCYVHETGNLQPIIFACFEVPPGPVNMQALGPPRVEPLELHACMSYISYLLCMFKSLMYMQYDKFNWKLVRCTNCNYT